LTSINLSGVTGSSAFAIGENSLAAASVIQGSVGATAITYDNAGQAGATQIAVTLQNGNNSYAGGAVDVAHVITAGSGNNTISTGAGADVITVGSGINTISAGTGTNIVTLGASRTATSNSSDIVFVAPSTDSIRNFVVTVDDLQYDVSEYDAVATNALLTTGSGAAEITATAANATVSFQTIAAAGAVTTTAGNEVLVFSLAAFNSAAAIQTAIQTGGGTVITFSDALTGITDGAFLAAYDDGVNSYLALIRVEEATTTAAATVTNVATLVGVADVTTLTTGDFAFI
jgi:S-layer protein